MVTLNDLKKTLKGGTGSGHHGHGGRPGKRGGSSPGKGGGGMVGATDFSTMSRSEATGATVKRLSNAKQATSVTGKPQNRIVVSANGNFSKVYSELEGMGWSETWSNKSGTKRWQPGDKPMGYNRLLSTQENNPVSGSVNMNIS